ncbi:sensor histidine kinase [Piscibacillus halophilus]|uniref:sensor histidine kinase n=1 Tax=Piscibacillus halophilus TaxID=571933 RepID=UPI0015899F4A|nr:HAMP domain-containing sensor histidine kinase [Piscibacillus halophilus]
MTIKKRLLLSNIAMVVIPVIGFLMIEIMMSYLILFIFDGEISLFLSLRFISLLIVLIVTNGLLTYFVAKSIIKPIQQLSNGAQEITKGNLDFSIEVKGKDEISELAETFEKMRQQLKETEELNERYEQNRKELIASISHDLKTPITSIKGYVNGIRDGVANTPEKMNKYIETISAKSNELDDLIDELFMYSKLNLNKIPFHYEKMDLKAYLEDYVDELRFDIQERGGTVHFQIEEGTDYIVEADREKINRVMSNVIDNSLKYMDKEEPQIEVTLKSDQSQVTVEIKDNGSGISEESLKQIFDQFYRTDESRNSSTGGSGIGLAIVKQIIENHGGNVWAESKEGIGTSVYLTLPKVGEHDEENTHY